MFSIFYFKISYQFKGFHNFHCITANKNMSIFHLSCGSVRPIYRYPHMVYGDVFYKFNPFKIITMKLVIQIKNEQIANVIHVYYGLCILEIEFFTWIVNRHPSPVAVCRTSYSILCILRICYLSRLCIFANWNIVKVIFQQQKTISLMKWFFWRCCLLYTFHSYNAIPNVVRDTKTFQKVFSLFFNFLMRFLLVYCLLTSCTLHPCRFGFVKGPEPATKNNMIFLVIREKNSFFVLIFQQFQFESLLTKKCE